MRKTKDAPQSMIDLGLPHRPPFVFVRELVACDPGVSAECATTFAGDDSMFVGHFPGNPLVPGVILTERLRKRPASRRPGRTRKMQDHSFCSPRFAG